MGKYVIRKTAGGQFRWNLNAGNGQTLITSESYTTKQACKNGIASSQKNVSDTSFEQLSSKKGDPYFNQLAGNKQILGTSQMYKSETARDNGIESVKRNAPTATIEDTTIA